MQPHCLQTEVSTSMDIEQLCIVDQSVNQQPSFTCPVQLAENQQIPAQMSLTDLMLPPQTPLPQLNLIPGKDTQMTSFKKEFNQKLQVTRRAVPSNDCSFPVNTDSDIDHNWPDNTAQHICTDIGFCVPVLALETD